MEGNNEKKDPPPKHYYHVTYKTPPWTTKLTLVTVAYNYASSPGQQFLPCTIKKWNSPLRHQIWNRYNM